MANFTPDDKIIKIMANFASINPSMLIEPDKLAVMNNSKSVVARYTFDPAFTFEPFGLYDTQDALGIINAMSKPDIEVYDKYINIVGANDDKVRYYTTAANLVPKVPDVGIGFAKLPVFLNFAIPADKLAIILKMSQILKSKFIFFETEGKRIRVTVGDELESSGNNYDIMIQDGITENCLDTVVQIPLIDFKILPGEYNVTIGKRSTKWENLNGVVYYISTAAKK